MLEAALAAGLASAGGDVAARRRAADAGGAAARPPLRLRPRRRSSRPRTTPTRDNGIKFFGGDGFKLSDETEQEIELHIDEDAAGGDRGSAAIGDAARDARATTCASSTSASPTSSSAGSTCCSTAPTARPIEVGAGDLPAARRQRHGARREPDGRNINDGVRLDARRRRWSRRCASGGHDVGFAFDGDGDRVLAVDRDGALVDGDELLALAALHLRARGTLPGDGVVVTVMTNYGFHRRWRPPAIEVATTAVGDRYVLDELRERGWALGGEQSGHIIEHGLRRRPATGSPRALLALEALGGRDLRERDAMEKLPQRLVNVRVARPRAAGRARPACTRRSSESRSRSRGAAACSCARAAPSRSCA